MDKNESDEDEKQCTSVSEEIQDESNSSEVSSNKSDSITELHKPRKQYSRETLLELRNLDISKKCPDLPNITDIVLTSSDTSGIDFTPSFARKRTIELERDITFKRSISDKGQSNETSSGVVLGPQRPRFGTGCHVVPSANKENVAKRASSPSAELDGRNRVGEKRDQPRRIGSGRLAIFGDRQATEREYREKVDDRDRQRDDRLRDDRLREDRQRDDRLRDDRLRDDRLRDDRQRDDRLRDDRMRDDRMRDDRMRDDRMRDDRMRDDRMRDDRQRDERQRNDKSRNERLRDDYSRSDKRSFRRDDERDNFMRRDFRQLGGGRSRDSRNVQEAEEPEWFTEGPSSQLETIELVGFEADENRKKQMQEVKVNKENQVMKKVPDIVTTESNKENTPNNEGGKDEGSQPHTELKLAPIDIPVSTAENDVFGGVSQRPEPEGASLPKDNDDFDFDINQFIGDDISAFGDVSNKLQPTDQSRAFQWFRSDFNIAGFDGNDPNLHSMEMSFLQDLIHSAQSPTLAARIQSPSIDVSKDNKPVSALPELLSSISSSRLPINSDKGSRELQREVEDKIKALILHTPGGSLPKVSSELPMKKPMTAAELEATMLNEVSAEPNISMLVPKRLTNLGNFTAPTVAKAKTLEEIEAELVGNLSVEQPNNSFSVGQRIDPSILFCGGMANVASQGFGAKEQQNSQPHLSVEQQLRNLMTRQHDQASQNFNPPNPFPPQNMRTASQLPSSFPFQNAGLMGGLSSAAASGQPLQASLLLSSMRPAETVSPKAPSPIMFGNRPPVHLAAPLPLMSGTRPFGVNPPNPAGFSGVAQLPPSQQELTARNMTIFQNAVLRKQYEEQMKLLDGSRSPNTQLRSLLPPGGGNLSTNSTPSIKSVPNAAFLPTAVMRNLVGEQSEDKQRTNLINDSSRSGMGRLSPSDRAKEEAMRRAARDPSIPQNLMASRQPRALVGQKAPSQADFDFIKQLEAASAPMRRPIMKAAGDNQMPFSLDMSTNHPALIKQMDNSQRAIFGRDSGGQANEVARLASSMGLSGNAGMSNMPVQALLLSQLSRGGGFQMPSGSGQLSNSGAGFPTSLMSGGSVNQQQQLLMQRFTMPPPPLPQQQQSIRGLTPINQLTYMPNQQGIATIDNLRPSQPAVHSISAGQMSFPVPNNTVMSHAILGARSGAGSVPLLSPGKAALPTGSVPSVPVPLWGPTA